MTCRSCQNIADALTDGECPTCAGSEYSAGDAVQVTSASRRGSFGGEVTRLDVENSLIFVRDIAGTVWGVPISEVFLLSRKEGEGGRMSVPYTPGKLVLRGGWPKLVSADAPLDPPVAQVDCSMSAWTSRPHEEACANADRLAHCWNHHDDLAAALRRAEAALAWYIDDEGECDNDALSEARDVLAKVEQQEDEK
jgi:hypothetical protein